MTKVVMEGVLRYYQSYEEAATGRETNRTTGGISPMVLWSPPPDSVWKINVDTATFEGIGCGIGVVVRNSVGEVGRAVVKQVRIQWGAEIVEAKAALLGLRMAAQMGLPRVILESDCLMLIDALKSKESVASYFGNVVLDILNLVHLFNSVSFSFVKRGGNVAAHLMAHYAPLDFSTRIWVDVCPDVIVDVVASDAMSAFT
ncbi:uncharacterized protein LOC141639334 [Silene latifolia]|uniref:uncharacterized protein LOC141639334 n=1 Tax=Silene latifolia TaxID=37657 RepID=UPI003D7898FD